MSGKSFNKSSGKSRGSQSTREGDFIPRYGKLKHSKNAPPSAPDSEDAPEAENAEDAPASPAAPKAKTASASPAAPKAEDAPEAEDAEDAPEAEDAEDAPEAEDAEDAPEAEEASSFPGAPRIEKAPDSQEASNTGETSKPANAAGNKEASRSGEDAEIEKLDLAPTARAAAYELKKKHPSVAFTSGRRTKQDQARAMAGNVVKNRKWIEQTYVNSPLSKKCQDWVDQHTDKTTQEDIAKGLLSVLDSATDAELGRFSKHLSGEAFDVQPVSGAEAEKIKQSIRSLKGLGKFLDTEGGLVRWHAQF